MVDSIRCVARMSSAGVSRKPLGSRAAGAVFLFDLAIGSGVRPLASTAGVEETTSGARGLTPSRTSCAAYSRSGPVRKASAAVGASTRRLYNELRRHGVTPAGLPLELVAP